MPNKIGNFAIENKKIEKIRINYVKTGKKDHPAWRRT